VSTVILVGGIQRRIEHHHNERNLIHLKDIKTQRSDLLVMDMDATAVDALKNMITFKIATGFICN